MGADDALGGVCVVGLVPAGGAGCWVVEGGVCCVWFCASAAQGDANIDATTNAETKPARGLELSNTRRITSIP